MHFKGIDASEAAECWKEIGSTMDPVAWGDIMTNTFNLGSYLLLGVRNNRVRRYTDCGGVS